MGAVLIYVDGRTNRHGAVKKKRNLSHKVYRFAFLFFQIIIIIIIFFAILNMLLIFIFVIYINLF
jgi:hypothetical protein